MDGEVFKLRTKIDDLDIMTHKIALKFPKYERHVLGADVRGITSNIIRYEILAVQTQASESRNHLKPSETLKILRRLDAEVGLLKRQIQKADNLDYLRGIAETTRAEWSELTNEVGKMLGAWIKTVEQRVYSSPVKQQRSQGSLI